MAEATRAQADKWNKVQFYECSACGRRGAGLDRIGESTFCPECGTHGTSAPARRRVFVNSWSDWLDNEVPIEWLVDLLDRIRRCPNIDFLLLTKRIGNWRARVDAAIECLDDADPADCIVDRDALRTWLESWHAGEASANVWLGATVINQAEADRDVPKLLAVPARVRFLSIEPMLGAIDLSNCFSANALHEIDGGPRIDWIIAGGESGPHARPMHPDWVRSLRDQCEAAGVAFMMKQWGEFAPVPRNEQLGKPAMVWVGDTMIAADGRIQVLDETLGCGIESNAAPMRRIGKKAAGRLLDGVEHNQFPAVTA